MECRRHGQVCPQIKHKAYSVMALCSRVSTYPIFVMSTSFDPEQKVKDLVANYDRLNERKDALVAELGRINEEELALAKAIEDQLWEMNLPDGIGEKDVAYIIGDWIFTIGGKNYDRRLSIAKGSRV